MSISILQKIRSISLSNIHSVLDFLRQLNSIGEYEQYIRDLETARNQLDDQSASLRSDVQVYPQEIATLQSRHDEADKNINILLGDDDPSNDHLAAPLEAQLIELEKQIGMKTDLLATTKAQLAKFDEAVVKLNATLAVAKGKLETLRMLDAATAGQEKAAKALEGISLSEAPDVDGVETRLRRDAAIATNKFNRAIGGVSEGNKGGLDAAVAARISERRSKISAKKTAEV